MAKEKVRPAKLFKSGKYIKTILAKIEEEKKTCEKIVEIWFYNKRYFKVFKKGSLTLSKTITKSEFEKIENIREESEYNFLKNREVVA